MKKWKYKKYFERKYYLTRIEHLCYDIGNWFTRLGKKLQLIRWEIEDNE